MSVGNVLGYMPTNGRVRAVAVITNAIQYTDWFDGKGVDKLMLFHTYTRGAAGGILTWQIQLTDLMYNLTYVTASVGLGVVAVGVTTVNTMQQTLWQFGSTAAAAAGWTQQIDLDRLVNKWRIGFYETGVPLTPGTWGCDYQTMAMGGA